MGSAKKSGSTPRTSMEWVRRVNGEWVRLPVHVVASGEKRKPETRRLLQAELTQPEIPQLESSSDLVGPVGIAAFSFALLVGGYVLFRYLRQRKRGSGNSARLPSIP